MVSVKAAEATSVITHTAASEPTPNTIETNEVVSKITHNEAANASCERSISITGNQDAEIQGSTCQDAPSDPERIRKEEAATKAQAAFRGYLVSMVLVVTWLKYMPFFYVGHPSSSKF